jgi:hypothetical protein
VVEGNYIGTNVTGEAALPNSTQASALGAGVFVLGSADNRIGGTATGAGNLIAGNANYGVSIDGSGATGNLVQGNFIGTDATGTQNLGNAFNGVLLINGASGNLIGGTSVGARNLISGNGFSGVAIAGYDDNQGLVHVATVNNTVEGNLIGTDVTGTHAVGNAEGGVFIDDADNNLIGGTTPGSRNVISGNDSFAGVYIAQSFPGGGGNGNLIEGNSIGTDVTGAALGNLAPGVVVEGGRKNVIGGTAAGAGNVIAFNTIGVLIFNSPYPFATGPTSGNAILSNEIYGNAGLGIDLGGSGAMLPNDSQGHSGPNDFENFPVMTLVAASDTSRTVAVSMNSTPNTTFRVEFFANDPPDPASFEPGQIYLGFVEATTDAGGQAVFDYTYPVDATHPVLTATATDAFGDTSEFSDPPLLPVVIDNSPPIVIALTTTAPAASPAPAAPPAVTTEAPATTAAAATGNSGAATELTAVETTSSVATVSRNAGGEAVSARPTSTSSPVAEAPIMLGISFDGSDRAAPPAVSGQQSVSAPLTVIQAVEASQAQLTKQQVGTKERGDRITLRPEAQLTNQATNVVAATIDGDDSVGLVEIVRRGKSEAPPTSELRPELENPKSEIRNPKLAPEEATGIHKAAKEATDTVAGPEEATGTPAALPGLLKRLAVPVAVVLTAASWLWYRSRNPKSKIPNPNVVPPKRQEP